MSTGNISIIKITRSLGFFVRAAVSVPRRIVFGIQLYLPGCLFPGFLRHQFQGHIDSGRDACRCPYLTFLYEPLLNDFDIFQISQIVKP